MHAVIALLMVVSGRMHGIGSSWMRTFSTVAFAVAMAVACSHLFGIWYAPLALISVRAFKFGHGNFYQMQGVALDADHPETIERYGARWVWQKIFRGSIHTPAYSWWCMGLKWLLVGIVIPPLGLTFALFAPAAYQFSFHFTKLNALAEWLTTIYAGMILWILLN